MQPRTAWLLLGLGPLLLTLAGVAWVVNQRAQVLSEMHVEAVEPVLLAARRHELQGKINLGRSAIAHLVRDGRPDVQAQQEALAILRRLEFGHDGFFFVYDFAGNLLLHPRDRAMEGRNLLNLRDSQGRYTVQRLLAQARAGGGHLQYEWRRPSNGRVEPLHGYVEPIAGWEWMLGTGAFVDDAADARQRIDKATEEAIADTLARIAAVALLGALAVSAGALVLNLSEQRKADTRLRRLAAQLVHSQEIERARVARELHDGVTQSLVSVKFLAESAAAQQPSKPLEAVVTRLREILGEVRLIAHDLRPPLLDDLGLAQALAQFGREWQERSGVSLRCELAEPPPLPELVATALFRFAQEALGNVEAHAEAASAILSLQLDGAGLLLAISDDGRGFDIEAASHGPEHGLGLMHLRERVEMLGGQFQLDSQPGRTRIAAYLPRTAWTL
jgi:two-component system NarL family sensor kinase